MLPDSVKATIVSIPRFMAASTAAPATAEAKDSRPPMNSTDGRVPGIPDSTSRQIRAIVSTASSG